MNPFKTVLCVAAAAGALAACGGGGGVDASGGPTTPPASAITLTGTAATGAAMAGVTVRAINATGVVTTAITGPDGHYTLNIANSAPFVLSATDNTGHAWYSFAPAAGTANITPLTTLALLDANGHKPLADLLAGWASGPLAPTAVAQSATKVNANLQTPMRAAGLDPLTLNLFSDPLTVGAPGLDTLLDNLHVVIECALGHCTQTIHGADGNTTLTWNADIATGGYNVAWTITGPDGSVKLSVGGCKGNSAANTFSLLVQTSVLGLHLSLAPDLCVEGLPSQPTSQTAFCNDALVKLLQPSGVLLLSCNYQGGVGLVTARLPAPLNLAYTLTYSFVRH